MFLGKTKIEFTKQQQKVDLPILSDEECSEKFEGSLKETGTSQFCAGAEVGKDTCKVNF